MKFFAVALFVVADLVYGQQCPGSSPAKETCETLQRAAPVNNKYNVDVYKNAAALAPSANVILAPTSSLAALQTACVAAGGDTKAEIEKMYAPVKLTCMDILKADLAYHNRDAAHGDVNKTTGTSDFDDIIRFVNTMYISKDLKIKQDALTTLQNTFNKTFSTTDFKGNAAVDINKWVSDQTAGVITNLVSPKTVALDTQLTIVNAIYEQYAWAMSFDPFLNTQANFTNADGRQSPATFMNMKGKSWKYLDNSKGDKFPGVPAFTMLSLGDKWGVRSLMIFLPTDIQGLPAFEQALTADIINQAADQAVKTPVDVTVPKFTIKQSTDLAQVLPKMGISKIFSKQGDFSGILDGPASINGLVHRASINFQEKGVQAAAGTALSTKRSISIPGPKPAVFKADHPFFFVKRVEPIIHLHTIGRLVTLGPSPVTMG